MPEFAKWFRYGIEGLPSTCPADLFSMKITMSGGGDVAAGVVAGLGLVGKKIAVAARITVATPVRARPFRERGCSIATTVSGPRRHVDP
jgi:hypothetical protein